MNGKILLSLLPYLCALAAVVVGLGAYCMAVKNEIRLKYLQLMSLENMDDLIENEYKHSLSTTFACCICFIYFIFVVICSLML